MEASRLKTGWVVGGILAVLTIIEYVIAVEMPKGNLVPLAVIAVIKGWLIVQYFMHIQDLWKQGGHH